MTFTLDISRGNVEQALSFLREAKENIDMAEILPRLAQVERKAWCWCHCRAGC